MQLAVGFASDMMALHEAGMVHGDMHSGNLMLEGGCIYVIDLGVMKKVGDRMEQEAMASTVPEIDLKNKQFTFLREQFSKLEKESKSFKYRKLPIPEQLQNDMKDICHQIDEVKNSLHMDSSIQVYEEGPILITLLFGKLGFDNECFSLERIEFRAPFYQQTTPFLRETGERDYEGRIQWFLRFLNACNNRLRGATGKAYDDETIRKLSELLAWMRDPNPSHRPTSPQVFSSLLGIWEDNLEKLDSKYPAKSLPLSPRWAKWKSRNEKWFRQHADEEISVTNHPPLLATPPQRPSADQPSAEAEDVF
jgi:serine/threonine protein kinase